VSTTDFTSLATYFGATGQVWSTGDFNYDGRINALDFNILATNFGQGIAPASSLGSLVPEPASLVVLAVASLALRKRSKR